MDEHVVHIDASKKSLLEENSERIARLFDVRVSVKVENEAGKGQKTTCTLASDHAPDSVEKAKNYITALIGEEPECQTLVETFDLDEVKMILKHQDSIESASQVVISAIPSSEDVHFQGKPDSLQLASAIIQGLTKGTMPQLQESDKNLISIVPKHEERWCSPVTDVLENNLSFDCDPNFSCDFHNSTSSSLYSRGQNYSPCLTPEIPNSGDVVELPFANYGINAAVGGLQISSHTSDISGSDTDDDEDEELFQRDPEYHNKVEFAVKLGYTESHLLKALRKLGPEAGQNELLSELIKLGSANPKMPDVLKGSPEVAESLADEVDEISMITYQRKQDDSDDDSNLRPVVIDGSNLAMSHGNKEVFSCRGIQLAVDWFRARGHKVITVFVPQWRKETSRSNSLIKDQEILTQLEKENVLVFTPSRRIGGKRVVCYDDRYVLNLAVETDGIVVSNDNYRDLINEKAEFKKVVEERLLMYSFVNNRFMPPDDPLGRSGPTLENFLQKEPTVPEPLPPLCPYGSKRCTYGNKCKYYHPERKNMRQKSVTEKLAEEANQRRVEMKERKAAESTKSKPLKRSVHRTQSFNPNDIAKRDTSPIPKLDNTHPWGSTTHLESADDEKKKQFNQKLSENLKKMEQEEAMRDNQSKQKSDEFGNQSGLMWMDNARNSPVNLNVPGRTYDNQEFLSGHLLLAKKLSDEAESDKQKQQKENMSDSEHQMLPSPPLLSEGQQRMHSPEPSRTAPRPITNKQKLSRQYSLQGMDDPRITRHSSLQAKYSHDPRLLGGVHQFDPRLVSGNRDFVDSLRSDFQQAQNQERLTNYPVTSADSTQLRNYPGAVGDMQSVMGDAFASHMPVSRMVSAPDPFLQQSSRRFPQMQRQNSTSDPQLHKPDDLEQVGHASAMTSRGTLPMQDRSGSVRFQIGGPPHSSSNVQSFGQPVHSFSPYQMPEMDYTPHPMPGYPSMQQQMGMPFSGMSGIQQSHSMMPAPMQNPSHSGMSAGYSPGHRPLFGHQGNVWTDDLHSGVSSQGHVPLSMQGMGSGGVGIPPVRQQQSQSQSQGPIPEDTPILANDPRYKLYYHLCGLFPEPKVRAVMNQHPETTNPNDICAYIIGAK